MRADDLVILLEIARCGSLAGAASTLGLNHATISRRMSALEAELHAPLLVRRVQGCELTVLGQSLLKSCEQIESALAEVHDQVSTTPRERQLSGLVRVSTTDAFGAYFVAPTLADLHRINPGLIVELITQTRLTAYGVGADIEIGVGEPVVGRPGAEKLTDYRLGLYASHGYETDRGIPESIDELVDHSLVFYIESLLRVDDLDLLTRLTGTHQVAFGSTSVQAQRVATLAGAGIGLLPAFVGDPEASLRRVLPTEVAPVLEFTACLAPSRLRRPAAAMVLQAIRETVADRYHELMPQR
jgi:DNA-binding transcriptional LysR family regulator